MQEMHSWMVTTGFGLGCALALTGCAVTDLATDPGVPLAQQHLAQAIAWQAPRTCLRASYVNDAATRSSSVERLRTPVRVVRLYDAVGSDWVKADVVVDGASTSFYYRRGNAQFLCSADAWLERADSRSVRFVEMKAP
jgi:hypothetical protein